MTVSPQIAEPPNGGLVICPKTHRLPEADLTSQLTALERLTRADDLLQALGFVSDFPAGEDLAAAAAYFDPLPDWDGHEGPRARVTIAPGAIGLRRRDLARRERSRERAELRRAKKVAEDAAYLLKHGEFPPERTPQREITEWSAKSRANMVEAICEIDFRQMLGSNRPPAMVTLTYPGDWVSVASNGHAAKKHLQYLRYRYRQAWGSDLWCVWKLEFQRRGAPHFHIMMVPPRGVARSRPDAVGHGLQFRQWLSVVWADIVSHPDPQQYLNHLKAGTGVDFAEGMRMRDPKRAAIYFGKHGGAKAKEYQHIVPEEWTGPGDGPGRFWGYWALERHVYAVEVTEDDAAIIARTARRWSRAQHTTRQVRVPRVKGGRVIPKSHEVIGLAGKLLLASRGKPQYRKVRRRTERLKQGAGWVAVNNGARFAAQLGQYLKQAKATARAVVDRLRGEAPGHALSASMHNEPLLR